MIMMGKSIRQIWVKKIDDMALMVQITSEIPEIKTTPEVDPLQLIIDESELYSKLYFNLSM